MGIASRLWRRRTFSIPSCAGTKAQYKQKCVLRSFFVVIIKKIRECEGEKERVKVERSGERRNQKGVSHGGR